MQSGVGEGGGSGQDSQKAYFRSLYFVTLATPKYKLLLITVFYYIATAEHAHPLLDFSVLLSKAGLVSIFDIHLASKDPYTPPGEAKRQHSYHSAVLPLPLCQLIAGYRAGNIWER